MTYWIRKLFSTPSERLAILSCPQKSALGKMSLAQKLEKFRSIEPDPDDLLKILNRIDPEEVCTFYFQLSGGPEGFKN